jgi:hypothetical protein
MEIFSVDQDFVIGGHFISGRVPYRYALDRFLPLIGKLDIQRDPLKTKFYSRLEEDIVRGCIMPQITVAFIDGRAKLDNNLSAAKQFIESNIQSAFILDGIQRLNTLSRSEKHDGFDDQRYIYVTFLIASSRDRLLYRMITLNNGQRPMSARHQIDVLADAFFDFQDLGLKLVAEKGAGRVRAPDAFKKADFVKGYIAYLSETVNIDNQKIIEEKMDELIANRIIESDLVTSDVEFTQVVEFIDRISRNPRLKDWIRVQNNFIGVCAGIKKSMTFIEGSALEEIESAIDRLEGAISSINVSKVNLGKVRREVVFKYFSSYEDVATLDEFDLLDKVSSWIS